MRYYDGHRIFFWPWLSDYHMHFQVVCLSIPSVPALCLKDPLMGDDIIYPVFLLEVEVIHWNKLPKCWHLKDKNNSPLTIVYWNYIYIYICEREKLSLSLCLRGRQLRYLADAVFLSYSIFRRVSLLLEISFLILLSLVWILDLFSHLTLKTSIFIEDSAGNKHSRLVNQSQIILYTFTTFWLVSQSNVLIYFCGQIIPSTYQILIGHPIKLQYRGLINYESQPTPCGGVFLSLEPKQESKIWSFNLNMCAKDVVSNWVNALPNQKSVYLLFWQSESLISTDLWNWLLNFFQSI